MHHRSRVNPFLAVAVATALLLLVPFTAMRSTSEVRWGVEDFGAAALLLWCAGAGAVWVMRHAKKTGWRVALIGLLALILAVVWAHLAVGLFD